MASFLFTGQYPQGTVVSAYAAHSYPGPAPKVGDAPAGTPVVSAATGVNGALLTGLTDDTDYYVAANPDGVWRWSHIRAEEAKSPAGVPVNVALLGTDGTVGGPTGSPLSPDIERIVSKALGNVTGTVTPDLDEGNYFTATVTGDLVVKKPINWPAGANEAIIQLTQNGAGGHAVTTEGVVWLGGTLNSNPEPGAVTLISLVSPDAGAHVYAIETTTGAEGPEGPKGDPGAQGPPFIGLTDPRSAPYNAKLDGVTNDAAAFTTLHEAINAGEVNGYYLTATAKINSALPALTRAVEIKCFNGAKFDFSGVTGEPFSCLALEGAAGASAVLTADANDGDYLLKVATAYADGTLLKLTDPTTIWDPAGQKAKVGEIVEVGVPDGALAGINGSQNTAAGIKVGDKLKTVSMTNLNPVDTAGASIVPAAGTIKIGADEWAYSSWESKNTCAQFTLTEEQTAGTAHTQGTRVSIVAPAGTVFLRTPVTHEFGFTLAQGSKVTPITPVGRSLLDNIWVLGPGEQTTSTGIKLQRCRDVRVRNPTVDSCWARAIQFDDTIYSRIDSPLLSNARRVFYGSSGLEGYGIAFVNSTQDCTVVGGRSTRTRHAFTQGSAEGLPRRNTVTDLTAESTFADGFDSHGGANDMTLINCTSINANGQGFFIGCPKANLTKCRAIRPNGGGISCSNEGIGTTMYDIDVVVDTPRTGSGIQVAFASSTTGMAQGFVRLRGEVFNAPQYGVRVAGSGEGGAVNWYMKNVDIDVATTGCALSSPYASIFCSAVEGLKIRSGGIAGAKARPIVALRDVIGFSVDMGACGWTEASTGVGCEVTVGAGGAEGGSTKGVIREGPLINRGAASTKLDNNTTHTYVYPGPDESVTLGSGTGNQKCAVP